MEPNKRFGFGTADILKKSWTIPNWEKIDMLLIELNKEASPLF